MSKKNLQIFRHIIQLIAFIIYPGLFVSGFLAFKTVIQSVMSGTFVFSTIAGSVFLIIALLLVTILMGRFFCGFICSFGAMQDLMWAISQHTFKPKSKISKELDANLKYMKYVLLVLIVVIGWMLKSYDFDGFNSPWTVFAMYTSLSGWSNLAYFFTIGGLLLIAIMIASLFIERFFCRYLCPLGAVFTLFSKFKLFQIKKPRKNCGTCHLCTNKCSMGIDLGKYDRVDSPECINCFNCVSVCPQKNATTDPKPAVAAGMATVALGGLVYVGTIAASQLSTTGTTITAGSSVATNSNSSSSDSSTSASSDSSTASSDSNSSTTTTTGSYTDGTYTGSGTGLRGETDVKVVVSGGKITSITLVSYEDDEQYFSRAWDTVVSEIIDQQDVDVDAVSGATFSSNGIMEAVANALNVDFTNPNSTMSGGGHH